MGGKAVHPISSLRHAALGQQVLDITERQREAGMKPDRMLDDFGRKAVAVEGNQGLVPTVQAPAGGCHRVNVSMPRGGSQMRAQPKH